MSSMASDFRSIIDEDVQEFASSSRRLGVPVMRNLADLVCRAFQYEYEFIAEGIRMPQPANVDELRRRADRTLGALEEIQAFRQQNRIEEYSNHLATIAESILALSWITVQNTPLQFIRDMRDAGDYYGNRVLTAYRGNDEHTTWIKKWNAVLRSLEEYVRQHHRTGFSWNAMSVAEGLSFSANPPPPPPPPPVADIQGDADRLRGQGLHPLFDPEIHADRQQMLIQINQGPRITERLRPVNRDVAQHGVPVAQHRVPAAQHGVPVAQLGGGDGLSVAQRGGGDGFPVAQHGGGDGRPVAQHAAPPAHPPLFVLEGRRWRVEYHRLNQNLTLRPNNMSETVAMFRCERSTLRTLAKMNAVTIDNCKRCVVILEDIIASVELIRCQNVEVRCTGSCPNVTIDNCDSVQLFLSDRSVDAEVVTSKSTSTNICRLAADGDYIEFPVPEQIRSRLMDGNLQSSVIEHRM